MKLADQIRVKAKSDFFHRRDVDVFIVKMIGGYKD